MKKKFIRHHGGNIWRFGKVIDFSANINPEGLSPNVVAAIKDNLNLLVHYPDPECTELTQIFCKKNNLDPGYCLWGNGAAELFYLLFKYLKPGTIHLPIPSFCEYEGAALAADTEIRFWSFAKENNWDIDWLEIIAEANPGDLLVITNPNNPTGFLWTKQRLLPVIERAYSKNVNVLIDEAFIDFVDEPEKSSFIQDFYQWPNLFISYSLTKFYAIPGLRLGILLANKEMISSLKFHKDPWNVNLLAQVAGAAALQDSAYEAISRKLAKKRRAAMIELIEDYLVPAGVNFWLPQANYVLLELPVPVSDVEQKIRDAGFLIRNCQNFRGLNEYYCRVAIRTEAENRALILTMQEIITEVKKSAESLTGKTW